MAKETLLSLENASVHYGGVRAIDNVTLKVDENELIALMGPNGAGKSTALKALIGLAPLSHGQVRWHGVGVEPKTHEMAARGIAYVPQGRQVFKSLTVLENLELGGYTLNSRSATEANIKSVLHLFPTLREKLSHKAGLLSGGQQQMLTIARGLVADPKILLLDEPSLGLAPKVVKEVFEKIAEIHRERGIAVIVVEHSIKSVLAIATRVYVLSRGSVVLEGSPHSIDSEALHRVFLGQS